MLGSDLRESIHSHTRSLMKQSSYTVCEINPKGGSRSEERAATEAYRDAVFCGGDRRVGLCIGDIPVCALLMRQRVVQVIALAHHSFHALHPLHRVDHLVIALEKLCAGRLPVPICMYHSASCQPTVPVDAIDLSSGKEANRVFRRTCTTVRLSQQQLRPQRCGAGRDHTPRCSCRNSPVSAPSRTRPS